MKKLIVLVVILAAVGVGYYYFVINDSRQYVNDELGYRTILPKGWVVLEPSAIDQSRSVRFFPEGEADEESLGYVSIGVGVGSLRDILKSNANMEQTEAVLGGQRATKLYLALTSLTEYAVERNGKVLIVSTTKPGNLDVQAIIESFRFVE